MVANMIFWGKASPHVWPLLCPKLGMADLGPSHIRHGHPMYGTRHGWIDNKHIPKCSNHAFWTFVWCFESNWHDFMMGGENWIHCALVWLGPGSGVHAPRPRQDIAHKTKLYCFKHPQVWYIGHVDWHVMAHIQVAIWCTIHNTVGMSAVGSETCMPATSHHLSSTQMVAADKEGRFFGA